MTKEQAGAAMYVFLSAIKEQLGIGDDTEIRVKLDGETVKTVRLDETLAAWRDGQ